MGLGQGKSWKIGTFLYRERAGLARSAAPLCLPLRYHSLYNGCPLSSLGSARRTYSLFSLLMKHSVRNTVHLSCLSALRFASSTRHFLDASLSAACLTGHSVGIGVRRPPLAGSPLPRFRADCARDLVCFRGSGTAAAFPSAVRPHCGHSVGGAS